jgi:hypothetical protein
VTPGISSLEFKSETLPVAVWAEIVVLKNSKNNIKSDDK